jgi:hypothetical protein
MAMATLESLTADKLHDMIYHLAQHRRRGEAACNEILGRLLDLADRRSDEDDGDDKPR